MHKHEKKLEDDRDEADSSVGDKKKNGLLQILLFDCKAFRIYLQRAKILFCSMEIGFSQANYALGRGISAPY